MPSKNPLKFYADECFPLNSVKFLKSLGYSIVHASTLKTIGNSDRFHLKLSKKENRVLITLDRDFLYYEQVSLESNPGVIVVKVSSVVAEKVNKVCEKALKSITSEMLEASLFKISLTKITKLKDGQVVYEKDI